MILNINATDDLPSLKDWKMGMKRDYGGLSSHFCANSYKWHTNGCTNDIGHSSDYCKSKCMTTLAPNTSMKHKNL